MNIKKGDTVEVISGKDRGKRGEVLRVKPKEHRIVVQGINIRRKHQRAQPMGGSGRQTAPQIREFEAPLDAAKVMLVCPKTDRPTRIRHQRTADGKVSRISKRGDVEFGR